MTRTSSRCLYNQAGTLQIGYKLQTVVDSLFVSFPIDAFDLDRPQNGRSWQDRSASVPVSNIRPAPGVYSCESSSSIHKRLLFC
jgi:hypothetical protein